MQMLNPQYSSRGKMESMDLLCARVILLLLLPILTISTTLKLERAFPVGRNLTDLTRRDLARQQRIGIIDFPLLGSANLDSFGFYFTKVRIGSPPREYSLIMDTGSDITWVSCTQCIGCHTFNNFGIQLNFYDPNNSSSVSWISCSDQKCLTKSKCSKNTSLCNFHIHYEDGSKTGGLLVEDVFHFDTIMGGSSMAHTSKSVNFGCANYQSRRMTDSYATVDGILGLGSSHKSVISQLSQSGSIPNMFSHCLGGAEGGGILVLGEILEPGVVYAPLVPSRPGYNLNLQSISLNGKDIKIDPLVFASKKGTIVDSGTTLVFLAERAYDPFMKALVAHVSQYAQPVLFESAQCFQVTNRVDDVFPLISFNFEGDASMTLKPKEYLYWNVVDDIETWCTGFRKRHGKHFTIIGEMALRDKIVIYDLSHKRLGWVSYNCSRPVKVSMNCTSNSMVDARLSSVLASSVAFLVYICLYV